MAKKQCLKDRIYLNSSVRQVWCTRREYECLQGLLDYKSYQVIARELEISVRTVEYYISNVRSRFDVNSKYDLLEILKNTDFYEVRQLDVDESR